MYNFYSQIAEIKESHAEKLTETCQKYDSKIKNLEETIVKVS